MNSPKIIKAQAALDAAVEAERAARDAYEETLADDARKRAASAVAARHEAERNLQAVKAAHAGAMRQRIAELQAAEEQHHRSMANIREDAARALLEGIDFELQHRGVAAEAATCRHDIDVAAAELGEAAPLHPTVRSFSFALCELLSAALASSPSDRQQLILTMIRGLEPGWHRVQQLVANAQSRQEYSAARAAGS